MKKKNEKNCHEQTAEAPASAATVKAKEEAKEEGKTPGDEAEAPKNESNTVTLTAEALEEKLTSAYLKGLNTAIEAKMLEDMKELSTSQSLPMNDDDIKSLDSLLRGRRSVWDSI